MNPKALIILSTVTIAAVFASVALWLFGGNQEVTSLPVPATTPAVAPSTPAAPTLLTTPGTPPPSIASVKTKGQDYDSLITEALANDEISNAEARRTLLAIAYDKAADTEVRLEALEHGLNLMDDEDFGEIAPMWIDTKTPQDLLETLDFDLHGRGQRVALKNYLEVAKLSDHPLQADAMDFVSFFVDEEYGTNWNAWNDAIEVYLRENVDEEPVPTPANP